MSLRDTLVLDVAQNIALLPLLWLAVLRFRGEKRDAAWIWMASAFAVSWLADAATAFLPANKGWVPSMVYPVSQSAIIGAVLLERPEPIIFLAILVPIAIVGVMLGGADGPDIALRTFAWLVIVGVAWMRADLPHRLRLCLVVYFGLGYAMWMVHVEWLTVATWYPYQAMRLAGLLLFCWAASENSPNLRLVR